MRHLGKTLFNEMKADLGLYLGMKIDINKTSKALQETHADVKGPTPSGGALMTMFGEFSTRRKYASSNLGNGARPK
jgi:hypothetical protein